MKPFTYERPRRLEEAVRMARQDGAMLYAGGTTMLDLMKLGVYRPRTVVDITFLQEPSLREIAVRGDRLRLGALATMHDTAEHADVKRLAPSMSESLWLAASQQLRHMATLGGNVMQRTRDPYFRDPAWLQLVGGRNRRRAARPEDGVTPHGDGRLSEAMLPGRLSAVLGTSGNDTASYPGDWAQALVAFDTTVEIAGPGGMRTLPFEQLHIRPADKRSETDFARLGAGDVITAFSIPVTPALRRSTYLKSRDRESYAFANASVAAGLDLAGETVRDIRIGLGGVATVPWRAREAENMLRGQRLTDELIEAAGDAAFAGAITNEHNAFKVPLGSSLIAEAITRLRDMEG